MKVQPIYTYWKSVKYFLLLFIILLVFQMQETENMAGGMSYRTMNGIEIGYIMGYLVGNNQNSRTEISQKK